MLIEPVDTMRAIFRAFIADRRGATAIEYGVIVAVLSLAIVAGIIVISILASLAAASRKTRPTR